MQLRYLKTVLPPDEGIKKVTAVAWYARAPSPRPPAASRPRVLSRCGNGTRDGTLTFLLGPPPALTRALIHPPRLTLVLPRSPNSKRMAAVTTDRVVQLFDDNGDKRDKFSTKPSNPDGPKNFVVRGMAFSPDSTKLAIAQSDNIVFVYKLGVEWGDKKSICNKFLQHHPVAALAWPQERHNEVVFALTDGKVKVGQLKTNKAATLYAHHEGSPAVSVASNPNGDAVCSGHQDGSVLTFSFATGAGARICAHSCVPYALSWGAGFVCAAGADRRVVFYDDRGEGHRTPAVFDHAGDPDQREFSCAAFNPAGETVVVGSFDRFHAFTRDARRGTWEEAGRKDVANLYTVSALGWKSDGSKLTVGALCGVVDVYDACLRRQRYGDAFEFTHVSRSTVVVKRLATGARIVLRSHHGYDVSKINVRKNRFLVARTPETLLLGDMETCRLSEVPWNGSGSETFDFDTERVCVVHDAGELSVIEYGVNEVIGSFRSGHIAPHLLSIRVREAKGRGREDRKKIAHLVDSHTARVADLVVAGEGAERAEQITLSHPHKIDWLELNARATHLLFRDKKRQLHLFDLKTQTRHALLTYCSYAQWVPNSDVVVAQNRGNLCVWYSLESPDRVTNFPIRGEVEDIERSKGKTEVIVDEGMNTVSYALDESLIEFNSLLDDGDYDAAMEVLEPLELTPETEAMWLELRDAALADRKLLVAQRCSAAVGDVAKARFLGATAEDARAAAAAEGGGDGLHNYAVKARLAMMAKQWNVAESLLTENGKTDAAIAMYREMHRLDLAVDAAERNAHEGAENLRREHLEWLKKTGQEEAAGAVKEREGDHLSAIRFYLKGGLPGAAARVVTEQRRRSTQFDAGLVEEICAALRRADMYERAGELYDALGRVKEAKEAYVRGHAYRRAVELCKRPESGMRGEVRALEEKWGDRLRELGQTEAAINHFIDAGCSVKAAEAAMECHNWKKALEIVEQNQGDDRFVQYYRRIARHYEHARDFDRAERCFLRAGEPGDAVDMYCRADKWEAAHRVSAGYMTEEASAALYLKRAKELEANQRHKEAEKMYLAARQPDDAVDMYRRARKYDQMIRLVRIYREERLEETHALLAQQLEADGNLREAERQYLEAKDWKSAVRMYRASEQWEDAVRVAKAGGGGAASKQVAYAWANSLGGEQGAALLNKFKLLDGGIDHACETGDFSHAFELAERGGAKRKIPDVELKYAMFLEDEGRFADAEEHFVRADKPKEAIDMWTHQRDWAAAMRVAEKYAPQSVGDVLAAQAASHAEANEWGKAEATFVKAKRPEAAVDMYRRARMWDDALRVASDYVPAKKHEIALEARAAGASGGDAKAKGGKSSAAVDAVLARARALETDGDYSGAVDAYLELTAKVTKDQNALEVAWEAAVRVATEHVPGKARAVVAEACRRLRGVGAHARADHLAEYHGVGEADAGGYAPSTESGRVGPGPGRGAASSAKDGNVSASAAAAEEAARRGDWDEAHRLAAEISPECASTYSVKHANMELRGGDPAAAAAVLMTRGAPAEERYYQLYADVARETLAGKRDGGGERELKAFLLRLVATMNATPEISPARLAEFKRLLEAAHLAHVCAETRAAGLKVLSAKAAVSLLRYVGTVPADRAFFEAGIACRDADQLSDAFVFLNRYLDVTEAMDEDPPGAAKDLDHDDFEATDVPVDFPMPSEHFVPEHTREEVRDWVLALSMDQDVDQTLSTRRCGGCGSDVHVASLKCGRCGSACEACVVTGYPVAAKERVTHEGRPARREDWNRWVNKFGTDPWSGEHATPKY